MTTQTIRALFERRIDRPIEEVIKVDQTDEAVLGDEIGEYIVTSSIRSHYARLFDAYQEARNKPREGNAIWVSGFFGSGKSSFAKMLGLAISNRTVKGESAAKRFAEKLGDGEASVLLNTITDQITTHAVIFDVSTDRGILGNQTLTEIMYRLFLQSLGYARDLDLSELEITLEEQGKLGLFEEEYRRLFDKDWDAEKGKVAFALSQASRVLHSLEPDTYPMADSWVKAVKNKADITPAKLGDRAGELMQRRAPEKRNLVFVIDEVGQFVARDVQKMLDLQAVVQSLGIRGRGRHWVVVTSQEKLDQVVSGLDATRIELARLMDRFPHQVHLEPSDISEVTSRRVLSKKADAEALLGKLFDEHRGRLTEHTRLSADIKLPELGRDSFVQLYPLLPYQIDLIVQVVSGLRTQGGARSHVGGANRTIIKLAQQLLINPAVNLADKKVGQLATLDQVYDLVENNIDSEIRAKITAIAKELEHPLAQPVAKAICLLQYVKSIHRTAENIAAALHPSVTADSQLAGVREALRELLSSHKIRQGDDGYRIPTPAEDDWERTRNSFLPRLGDLHRLYREALSGFFQPQPTSTLFEAKTFKAGLAIHGSEIAAGDLVFDLWLCDNADDYESRSNELRTRSQQERKTVFWAIALDQAIYGEATELFRSKAMIERKERETRSESTSALTAEEKARQRRHSEELRRLLKIAALSGNVYFRGNDRSPGERATEVGRSATEILSQVLPDVFERFKEAAAKASDVKKGLDALLKADNLQGLPPIFASLSLLRAERGQPVFRTESGPLKEVMDRIEARANYGDSATGRFLEDDLGKEPFGWDFEAVRLLVASLMRAGSIDATSKSQTIDTVTSVEARETFANNNLFRQASFRPKKAPDYTELIKAAEGIKETFGSEARELTASAIVEDLRREIAKVEDSVASALQLLTIHKLPGGTMLENALGQMRAITREPENNAITSFNASYRSLKDAIKLAADIEHHLPEPRLHTLERARTALKASWPFLRDEADVPGELRDKASSLEDLLEKESFYKELPSIEQHVRDIEAEYEKRYQAALSARVDAYSKAFDRLVTTPGFAEIDEAQQLRLAAPFEKGKSRESVRLPIPQLRSERDACEGRLRNAIAELHRIIDGERVVTVNLASFFSGGLETEEQLESAIEGLREECARLIGAGKKVIVN